MPVRRSVQKGRAKINLTLRVHGRRSDGYHELESLVVFAEAGDLVSVETGSDFSLDVTGPYGDAIEGENLITRAALMLTGLVPDMAIGAVTLDKRLPVASGIGGGSADAAAFLRAVQDLEPHHSRRIPWGRVARELGADVPVCLASEPMLMTGIGDGLVWVRDLPRIPALLVTPDVPVPSAKTREIFKRLRAVPLSSAPVRVHPSPLPNNLADVARLVTSVGNDLSRPAVELWPVLATVAGEMSKLTGVTATGLSGAGPTTFALFETPEKAQLAAREMTAAHPAWWICPTTLG